jgi:hypothetical protein
VDVGDLGARGEVGGARPDLQVQLPYGADRPAARDRDAGSVRFAQRVVGEVVAVSQRLDSLVVAVGRDRFLQRHHVRVEAPEHARDRGQAAWPVHVVAEQVLCDHTHVFESCRGFTRLHDDHAGGVCLFRRER